MAFSLCYYSRMRFIANLLPLIQQASSFRRVVSVFAGACEGPVSTSDIPGMTLGLLAARGHASSLVTLGLESTAARAPDVSFIHDFPGNVKTTIMDNMPGGIPYIFKPFMCAAKTAESPKIAS